jgi:hypothetical protein
MVDKVYSKSPVQIMRQRVLGPGSSDHNGRGSYEMDTERTFDEVMARVKRLQEKTDLIASVHSGDRSTTIVTFRQTWDPKNEEKWYYRQFIIVGEPGDDQYPAVWGVMVL